MTDTPPETGGERADETTPDLAERLAIAPDCSHEEFLAVARVYAREIVDRHDLSVDVSDLEWTVSTRAKRRAGVVRHRDGEPRAIGIAWAHFEANGWTAVAGVIRHELIHVHLLVEDGDAGHGPAFRRLADRLDAPRHCERFADPAWWVVCEDCGDRLARYRRSKLVERPDRYRCGDCGGAFQVERNA